MITGTSTVYELLNTQIDFEELFDLINPSNKFLNVEVKDFINLPYQKVMDVLAMMTSNDLVGIVKVLTKKKETKILKAKASEFISFLKFIKNQNEIIVRLLQSLASETFDNDDMLLNASGIEKLNKYNEIMVYYSIDKNPVKWNAIGKQPFSVIFTKLSIDKDLKEINKNYSLLLKQKNK